MSSVSCPPTLSGLSRGQLPPRSHHRPVGAAASALHTDWPVSAWLWAVGTGLGTDRKLTSLFFFGTRRNQLLLILNGQAWKWSLPGEREGREKQPFGGGSGQGIKEAGLCWKLCSLAKTRWKDQFGLYELVPSFFWVCFSSSVKQVGPLGCLVDRAQDKDTGSRFLGLGLEAGAGLRAGGESQT